MLKELLVPVVLPGLVATLVLLAAWRPWRRGLDEAARAALSARAAFAFPVLLCAAMVVAFASQEWPGELPPPQKWQWLLLLAGGALVPAMLAAAHPSVLARTGGAVLAGGLVAWLLRLPGLDDTTSRATLGILTVVLALALEWAAARRPGPVVPLAGWLAFTAASVGGLESGFAKVSLIAAGGSAACGAAAFVGVVAPRFRAAHGGGVALAPLLVGVLAVGVAYRSDDFPGCPFWLAGAAPLGAVAWEIVRGRRAEDAGDPGLLDLKARLGDAIQLVLPALLAGAAIAIAATHAPPSEDDGSGQDWADLYGPG